jgi:hypothetical protein
VLRDAEAERQERAVEYRATFERTENDSANLRHAMKLKDKELRLIRANARAILKQRNEVESFFHAALATVKQVGVVISGNNFSLQSLFVRVESFFHAALATVKQVSVVTLASIFLILTAIFIGSCLQR